MSDSVIIAQDISKRYRLGVQQKRDKTFVGQLVNVVKAPFTNFRQLAKLSKFSEEDESVFWALKDINFEVKRGEVLGIIGKNGAGKSTLLKILSRITDPTTGSIKIRGRVASLLEVGTGFHPELTGRENVYMNGTILGMRRREIERKFDEIIDFSGVEKFIDTAVKFYSSGMKVRLGFAVAAHLDPEILIIDEVLAVGDAEFQAKCLGKMQDVTKNQGRTVLFVSHNMGAVASLCTTAIMMENGVITQKGLTNSIVDTYLLKNQSADSLLSASMRGREGEGQVVMSRIFFRNFAGAEVQEIISGEYLEIVVLYERSAPISIRSLVLGISVYDRVGRFVTVLNSSMSEAKFRSVGTTHEAVKCILQRTPFMSGIFSFTFSLVINGILEDKLELARTLTIHEGDFYKSGLSNAHGRQGVYIDQRWELT